MRLRSILILTLLLAALTISRGRAQDALVHSGQAPTTGHTLVTSSQDCTSDLVPRLEAEFRAAIASASQTALQENVSKSNSDAAKAWHELAVLLYIQNKPVPAAWAALKSLTTTARKSYVASAGIILGGIGKPDEGRQLLLCARGLGDNSPYTLEALAAVDARLGDSGAAKAAINEIPNDALADPMIDIEQSFLNTGKPPPRAPHPVEALERCAADLDRHMTTVIAEMTQRDLKFAELARLAHQTYVDAPLVVNAQRQRDAGLTRLKTMIKKAVDAPSGNEWALYDAALSDCILQYFQFTRIASQNFLNAPQGMIFWAEALQSSPEGFVTDMVGIHTGSVPGVESATIRQHYADDKRTNDRTNDSNKCPAGPQNQACADRVKLAWCTQWQQLFDKFSDATKQRYDIAAHGFDRAAVEILRAVYIKVDDARGFAIRNFANVKPGPRMPSGDSFGAGMVNGWENDIRRTVDVLLTRDADRFLREEIAMFTHNRHGALDRLNTMQAEIDNHCLKVVYKAVFEELEREAYDEYQKELWDRLAGDIKTDYDAKIHCTVEVGDVTLELGEDGTKLSSKWQNIKAKLDDTGKLKVSGSWKAGPASVNVDDNGQVQISAGGKPSLGEGVGEASVGGGVTVQGGEITGASIGGTVDPGGIEGEGSITIFSDNENTGQSEPALLVKGSVSVGAKAEGVGSVSCTPGEFSAEIYPRSFVADAVQYLVSTR